MKPKRVLRVGELGSVCREWQCVLARLWPDGKIPVTVRSAERLLEELFPRQVRAGLRWLFHGSNVCAADYPATARGIHEAVNAWLQARVEYRDLDDPDPFSRQWWEEATARGIHEAVNAWLQARVEYRDLDDPDPFSRQWWEE